MQMMYRLVLRKSITVPGVSHCTHNSRVSSDFTWISDKDNLILTNSAGDEVDRLTDLLRSAWGGHTVTSSGDLIYLDRELNIIKLTIYNKVKTILIKYIEPWKPRCVCSSPSTGDLLVGMVNADTVTAKVNRYTKTGQCIQTIQHDNKGQGLYRLPNYIKENLNGDVIVSDVDRVVVSNGGGRLRFCYEGPLPRSRLKPRGICTDELSHILVCDVRTGSVHIISKDGEFLSQIKTSQDRIYTPCGLSYDDRTQLLWVGSETSNKVNIYRLVYGDYLAGTYLPLEKKECSKHPSYSLTEFCVPCETSLCEICITTSSGHKHHDVRDVEKLFHDIHKRKDGDALLMCLLLCQNYRINLEEEHWMEKYNAVADVFKFKKLKKKFDFSKLKKYKPVLKQNSSIVEFSCKFFRDTSFLRFAKERRFVDMFLFWAEKENISKFCRSSNYLRREDEEEVCCWLLENQTEQLIDRLGEDMFTHVTMKDKSIHELVYSKLGIPVQVIMRGDDSVKNFLDNLKKGKTTMYYATGMLIGCAGSGKSTLLGRLKDIDLEKIQKNTRSTRGIDIQTDVFDVSNTIEVNFSNQKQRFSVMLDEKSQYHNVTKPPEEISDEMKSDETKSLDICDPRDIEEAPISEATYNYNEEVSRDSINTESELLKGDIAAAPLSEKADEKATQSRNATDNLESLGILKVSKSVLDEPEKKISMVDFAGQCSYYSSHQIFLSPRAFFILVFNMEKKLNEIVGKEVCNQEGSIYKGWTHRDYVTFWAKNIHQYSSKKAPIILVGTHAEEKTEEEKGEFFREIWKTLETKDKSLQRHLDKKKMFAIGFHENESIDKIKLSIIEIVQKLDHWGEKLPHSWAMFENFFQEKKHLKIIKKGALFDFNEALPNDITLATDEDINTMLQYFHDVKEILYFHQKFLERVIILDVQWFADAFKNIITDKNHAKEDLLEYASVWDKFNVTGELNDTLLSAIWKMNNNEFMEHKDDIMLYMEKLGLLAKVDNKKWYVPCMNKKQFPMNAFTSYPASSILCFTFDILPAGIFHRLVASCMQIPWSIVTEKTGEKEQPCIYQTAAVFLYRDHNVLVGMTSTEIQLQVFVIDGEVDLTTCTQIQEEIEGVLHMLSNTFQKNMKYQIAFKCKPVGFCDSERSHVIKEYEFKEPTFQCPYCPWREKHIIHTSNVTKYWKKKSQAKNVIEKESIPNPIEFILNVVSKRLRGITSPILAANFGVHLEDTNLCLDEERFRILYKWKCKYSALDHLKELEGILRKAEQSDAADCIGTVQFSDFRYAEIFRPCQGVSKKDILVLSEKLSNNYTHLVRFLGLPHICIEQIEANIRYIEDRIFKSLMKLKEKRPYLSHQDICRALKFIERSDVADYLNIQWKSE
ncbi:uncharacterized protein LOC134254780 [Saccostrea cucullata]|uniref:uncharacterized protein LOC134254780 n=1 Tax=Saccostrea cuccullata TaxID=36930 RepID=UPI002ED50835